MNMWKFSGFKKGCEMILKISREFRKKLLGQLNIRLTNIKHANKNHLDKKRKIRKKIINNNEDNNIKHKKII